MLAAVFGGGGVRLREVAAPLPGPGEVLVRVRAVEVTPGAVPGGGIAGTVVQLGAGSFGWEVGDEVLGRCGTGAWAQFAAVADSRLAERPAGLPREQACVLAGSGRTVETALTSLALRRGETLLVLGAGRGPGPLAVRLALARGATVLAAAARHDHAHLRGIGAHPVAVPSHAVEPHAGPRADPPAARPLHRERTPPPADAVLVVSGEAPAGADRVARLDPGAAPTGRPADLVEWWDESPLHPEVAAVLPLHRAGRALRLAAEGRARGAVVVQPWPIVSFGR